jgi:prepilin-type N-terminal cleavage/methylation domain-containing protein
MELSTPADWAALFYVLAIRIIRSSSAESSSQRPDETPPLLDTAMRNQGAFTLTEIIAVIAIVAVLAAVAAAWVRTPRDSALRAMCLSNMHQLGMAIQQYVQDHDGALPIMTDATSKCASVRQRWVVEYGLDPSTLPAIGAVLNMYLGQAGSGILFCPNGNAIGTIIDDEEGNPCMLQSSDFVLAGSNLLVNTYALKTDKTEAYLSNNTPVLYDFGAFNTPNEALQNRKYVVLLSSGAAKYLTRDRLEALPSN